MITILLLISAMVSVFYLLFPFGEQKRWGYGEGQDILALEEKKEVSLIAIHDIDFEHAAGKISKEDYEALRRDFKEDAVNILREIKETGNPIWTLSPEHDIAPSLKRELIEEVTRIQGLRREGNKK